MVYLTYDVYNEDPNLPFVLWGGLHCRRIDRCESFTDAWAKVSLLMRTRGTDRIDNVRIHDASNPIQGGKS